MSDDEFVKAIMSRDFEKADIELEKICKLSDHHYKKITQAICDAIKEMRGKYGSDDFLRSKIRDMVGAARAQAFDNEFEDR